MTQVQNLSFYAVINTESNRAVGQPTSNREEARVLKRSQQNPRLFKIAKLGVVDFIR